MYLLELVQLPINKLLIAVEFGALGEELFHFGFVLNATKRTVLKSLHLLLLQ